ncbi:MAG: peptidoglycan DD-metalloendopeptidase family protein [Candidatus Bathyarchaeota archaeon]|nr:peptidoglycan DD-metalloendopeptidase family protein [Candidatus Termiticorpusculum sp.]
MKKFDLRFKRVMALLLTVILCCPYFSMTAWAEFDEQAGQETEIRQGDAFNENEEISDSGDALEEDVLDDEGADIGLVDEGISQEAEEAPIEEEPMRAASVTATCGCISVGLNQAAFEDGDGTSADPFEIWTAEQLNHVRAHLGASTYFIVMDDIDLDDFAWTPIGTNTVPFGGVLNGDGHEISNLTVNLPSQNYVGLFGYSKGTIKNLTLKDISITGKDNTGGLVGYNNLGIIDNCSVTGNSSVTGGVCTGGFVGQNIKGSVSNSGTTSIVTGGTKSGGFVGNADTGTIEKCYATGEVTITGSYPGGFAGYLESNTVIEKCYATGNVSSTSTIAGGFAGYLNSSATLRNCFATGRSLAKDNSAGFVGWGYNVNGKMENCYTTTSNNAPFSGGGFLTVTDCYFNKDLTVSANTQGRTTAQMADVNTYVGWDFVNVWQMDANEGYPVLRGMPKPSEVTSVVYTAISTASELDAIRNNLVRNYVLVANIDMTGINWTPIGTSTLPFVGILDGNGFEISNLTVNLPAQSYVGLFGYNKGTVKNLKLKDINITGKDYTGGLIGYNNGIIDNCAVMGDSSVTGGGCTGGFMGFNTNGRVTGSRAASAVSGSTKSGGFVGSTNIGTIEKCFATGNVSATGVYSGGFAGYLDSYTVIEKCGASGNVTSTKTDAGGFAGYLLNGTLLKNCFSVGSAAGTGNVSGFLGSVYSGNGIMENCYTTTSNSSPFNGHGTFSATVVNGYFNKDLSPSVKPEGRTTAQMRQRNTYVNWDFDDVWGIDENVGYPYLIEATEGDALIFPSISREITMRFGVVDTAFSAVHEGVDVQGRAGDYVYSASNGVVMYVGADAHYGNVVYVNTKFKGEHIQIRYAHLANGTINVAAGDRVRMGDVLAEMGTSGDVTINNTYMTQLLEIEILESTDGYAITSNGSNGIKVNPLDYFKTIVTDGYYMTRAYNYSLDTVIPPSTANAAYVANAGLVGDQAYLRKIVEECVRETLYENDMVDVSGYLTYNSSTGTATVSLNGKTNTYNALDVDVTEMNNRLVVDYTEFINYFYRAPSVIPYDEEEARSGSDARSSSSATRGQLGDENLPNIAQIIINGKLKDGNGGLSWLWTETNTRITKGIANHTLFGDELDWQRERLSEIGKQANRLREFDLNNFDRAVLINRSWGGEGNGHNAVLLLNSSNEGILWSYYPYPPGTKQRPGNTSPGDLWFKVLDSAEVSDLMDGHGGVKKQIGIVAGVRKGDPNDRNFSERFDRFIQEYISQGQGFNMMWKAVPMFNEPPDFTMWGNQCDNVAQQIMEAGNQGYDIASNPNGSLQLYSYSKNKSVYFILKKKWYQFDWSVLEGWHWDEV